MNPRRPLLIQYSKSVPHAHLAVLRSPSPAGKRRLAKRVPLDSFSLREKVAAGRMRVKTLGRYFANALFSPSPQPPPAGRGRSGARSRTSHRLGQALCLLAAAQLLACSGDASESQFEEANRLYGTGKFAEAASLYQAAATNGVSANLLFNIGNAHYKAGRLGRAMAAYHRSLRLDPRNPETQANLRFAREQANTQPPTLTLRQRWLRNLSLGEWTVLASAAITLFLLLLAARQLKPGAFEGNPSWIRLPGLGALAAALLLALAASDHFSDSRAFVIEAKVVVRNGPLEESPESFKATDGTELLVHDRKGDFLEVESLLGLKGWIHSDDVELLTP